MLRELHFQNFKAWADTGKIRMAPLTIFCGNNSSGKSSIAQFLLMLKQTVESYDRQRVLHFGDSDTVMNFGGYRDIIFNQEKERNLRFQFSFDSPMPISESENISADKGGSHVDFECEISRMKGVVIVKSLKYQIGDSDSFSCQMDMEENGKYQLSSSGFTLDRLSKKQVQLPKPEHFFGIPEEVALYYKSTGILNDLTFSVYNLLKGVHYVGPLRDYPEKYYQYSNESPTDVGVKGKLAINALLASVEEGRMIVRGQRKSAEHVHEVVVRSLQKMGLIHSFRVIPIAEGRKQYEVLIRVHPHSPEVLITDVGFGISQILPVIVQCYYAQANSILLFEQPEIHLHPSVQSHLGDLFIDAIKAKRRLSPHMEFDGLGYVQIVAETHSEHLIRRIQRRIAEGVIQPEDVAIYFVHQGVDGAKMEALNIDLFGNVTNWPDNFFGDELEDLAAITKAARERKMKGDG